MRSTNEAKLRELQDHPVFWRQLQGKVLHGGKVVGLGHNVILQLNKHTRENQTVKQKKPLKFRALIVA